jgi:outer membrane protein
MFNFAPRFTNPFFYFNSIPMRKTVNLVAAVSLFAVLATQFSQAQTDQGNVMVGSSIAGLEYDEDKISFSLSPTVGYFVIDKLAIGLTPSIGYTSSEYIPGYTYKSTQLGIGPFVRYYIGGGDLKPLLHAGYLYLHNQTNDRSSGVEIETTTNTSNLRVGAGAAYFINDNVSVDGIVNYNTVLKEGSGGSLQLSFGFQIFF